jgi:hypothetical protein
MSSDPVTSEAVTKVSCHFKYIRDWEPISFDKAFKSVVFVRFPQSPYREFDQCPHTLQLIFKFSVWSQKVLYLYFNNALLNEFWDVI